MGTPFLTFVPPPGLTLRGFDRLLPRGAQPSVPPAFVDAMAVRLAVFVEEQGVPPDNEFDDDDPRSCHWVAYASVNEVVQHEEVDAATGAVLRPRRSETTSKPIGTVRLVPFPHPPHPTPGAAYVIRDGEFVLLGAHPSAPAADRAAVAAAQEGPAASDRATSLHDGKEPYVKFGRLAVLKEFRGHKIGRLLVEGALAWLRANPSYFNPKIAEVGLERLGIDAASGIPEFGGLVCAHAQEQAVRAWERMGFSVDSAMGRWWEEDIAHVGMFLRLDVALEPPRI